MYHATGKTGYVAGTSGGLKAVAEHVPCASTRRSFKGWKLAHNPKVARVPVEGRCRPRIGREDPAWVGGSKVGALCSSASRRIGPRTLSPMPALLRDLPM